MNQPAAQPEFPFATAVVLLTVVAGAAWGMNAAVLPAVLGEQADGPLAIATAVVAVWLGSLAGMLPVMLLSRVGASGAVFGYLYGAGARAMVGLSAFIVAAAMDLPCDVLAVALITTYLLMLVVDVILVSRYLSRLPVPPGSSPGTPGSASVPPASSNPSEVLA